MQKNKKEKFKIVLITILLFIFFDFLIGNYIFKKILRKNYFDVDTNMATGHPIYHHDIKKNYKTDSAGWGGRRLTFCSDNFGFINFCNKYYDDKKFDIGFIGDSQTMGLGIEFKDTFVNLIQTKLDNKKIVNLAASSYSPSIYYTKIKYLIENGFEFKEIIVFVDMSDLHDDTVRYTIENDRVVAKNINFDIENYNLQEKVKKLISRHLKISNHIYDNVKSFLIKKNFIKKPIPYSVENNFRSTWTYKYEKKWYDNNDLDAVINKAINNMTLLYDYLNERNIKLSIAVFPWPSTIKDDQPNNLQLKIWKDFCVDKCKNFYDLMTPFFDEKEKIGYIETYFKYYIYGDIHINENGHKLIANHFMMKYKN